jgi:UDP-N-acetylmuramate--alanine ligase
LFQPHTYTRTKNLLSETAQSFGDADVILLLPIFASREQYDPSIGSHHIARQIKQQGGNATCFDDFAEAEAFLRQHLIPGDVLVTMGAGDVYKVGEALLCT